jgi:salicylate hydroxylase
MLAAAIPADHINLNHRCVAVSSSDGFAVIRFSNGRQEEADLVVGCDGIRSSIRTAIHGADAPRFTGNVCWRAVIPAESLPAEHVAPDVNIWSGPGGHIVIYYVRAGRLVNIIATHESEEWVEESWNVASSRRDLIAAFPELHRDLRMVLDHVDTCFKWGLFDREPLPVWSWQRITLLGDAAHPMLPSLGQGAGMAIEDALILARAVGAFSQNISAALAAYEAARVTRTARVQLAARRQARIFHKDTASPTELSADWIYDYDPTAEPVA